MVFADVRGEAVLHLHRKHLACSLSVLLSAHRVEALTAVHGPIAPGLEGHLGELAAVGAGHFIHLTGAVAVLITAGSAAGGAAGGLIHKALLGEERLLRSGEHEFLAAVTANERFILIHGKNLLQIVTHTDAYRSATSMVSI